MFSPRTRAVLEQAGWYKGYTTATTEAEEALRSASYPVPAVVRKFLKQFGGLRLQCPHPGLPAETEECHFDAKKAVAMASPAWIQDYSERIGTPLSVIGEAANGYMILTMDPIGRVYAGYDDILRFVGSSGVEAIEALCTEREMAEVPTKTLARAAGSA
jgi:SUKH-3 immunity protein